MDINDLIAALTEGLPADQATIVKAAIERDAVKAKASGWKQAAEYDTLNARAAQLQAALDGGPDKPGAKAYQDWYEKHYAGIQQLQADRAAYEAKFGKLDGTPVTVTPTPKAMTAEEIQREVDNRWQTQYASKVSDVVLKTGKIMQRHLRNKRPTDVDFDALAKEANAKYGGDLERAYDEWDKPEAEKVQKASTEAEIDRRVKEKLQQAGASAHFPGNADQTPGAMALRTKKETDGFDKNALSRELVDTFVAAGNESVQ